MHRGVTSRRVGGAKAPVRVTTANNYLEVAKGLLGWYCRCKLGGWDGATPPQDLTLLKTHPANAPEDLSLRDVFPSSDAEGAALAIEYLQWLDEKRGVLPSTEAFQLRCLIALKWLHGSQTNEHGAAMEQPVVMEPFGCSEVTSRWRPKGSTPRTRLPSGWTGRITSDSLSGSNGARPDARRGPAPG